MTGENNFYDGMITCSTLSGKAVCRLVWAMNKAENDAYLERAMSGIPAVSYTHLDVYKRQEFARSVADVVIYMADGVIEEFGTPEEVFGNPRSEKTRNFLQGAQNARDGLA